MGGRAQPEHAGTFLSADYTDKPLEKPLKLVLKVGGSEVTELSGSGHDSSYYDDRSDHERERHREKKKKKKKKAEKEKHLDDEERRKRKVGWGSWARAGPRPWRAGGKCCGAREGLLLTVECRPGRCFVSRKVLCFPFSGRLWPEPWGWR